MPKKSRRQTARQQNLFAARLQNCKHRRILRSAREVEKTRKLKKASSPESQKTAQYQCFNQKAHLARISRIRWRQARERSRLQRIKSNQLIKN